MSSILVKLLDILVRTLVFNISLNEYFLSFLTIANLSVIPRSPSFN
nr:MAG TPA: hypothetical protein [Bacteriophage sp.]